MQTGRLVYVMGPSGSGKDSVLEYARRHPLLQQAPIHFARRYITRPAASGGENHIPLSREEFRMFLRRGAFALHWESHGNLYGIDRSIDERISEGAVVVINGARRRLDAAVDRYHSLLPVEIRTSAAILEKRLRHRGRESEEDIAARLQDAERYTCDHPALVCIENSGPLEEAGEELAHVLRSML